MSWLRWWTGTVNDPKWRIVALRAKCRAGDCVAVWAYLLEVAKDGEGDISNADAEECAIVLGYEVETVSQIIAAMRDKSLIEGARLASWEKRQPKREDDSKARVAAYRARQAGEKSVTVQSETVCNADVTQCNAPESESETDKNTSSLRSDVARAPAPKSPKPSFNARKALLDLGCEEVHVDGWLKVRQAKRAPLTEAALAALQREANKTNVPVAYAVRLCAEKSWQSFQADWKFERPASTTDPPPAAVQSVWVEHGSAEWKAWEDEYRRTQRGRPAATGGRQNGQVFGRYFPSRMPPNAGS